MESGSGHVAHTFQQLGPSHPQPHYKSFSSQCLVQKTAEFFSATLEYRVNKVTDDSNRKAEACNESSRSNGSQWQCFDRYCLHQLGWNRRIVHSTISTSGDRYRVTSICEGLVEALSGISPGKLNNYCIWKVSTLSDDKSIIMI